jgi:broad specificity phosphatase PhoE
MPALPARRPGGAAHHQGWSTLVRHARKVGPVGVRELVLVRHGESEGNVAAAEANAAGAEVIDVPARDPDVRLSDLGREQAMALGATLAASPPDLVRCSPYVRAAETARLALEAAGLAPPVRVDERLRDRELGVLDRLTERGVVARYPEEHERRRWQGKFYHRPAGGESWADVALRLRTWLSDLDAEAAGARVLVVCHDVVIVLLRYVCEGLDEEAVVNLARTTPMRNAARARLVRAADGRWSVAEYDAVEHLRAAGLPVTEHRGARHAHE